MSTRHLTSLIPRPHHVATVVKRVIELAPGLPGGRSERVEPPAAPERPAPPPPPAKPKPRPKAGKPRPKPAKPEKKAKPGKAAKPKDPHHALNNPVTEPDPTEWPDPYEKRPDPRDPPDPDGEPFGEEPHAPPGATSTSEPPPDQDPVAEARQEKLKREKLDQ
jgi:hypothetical protein